MGSWSMSQNLNICYVFWMNQVQMSQSVVGKWQVGGGLQVLLGLWLMLGVSNLRMFGIVVRQ